MRGRASKGTGEPRIRHELKRTSEFSAEVVAAAMSELSIDWFELAVKVFEKNMRGTPASSWVKSSRNSHRSLYYRGFTHEQIRYAIEP